MESLLNKLFRAVIPDEDIKDEEVIKLQEEISGLYITIHSLCSTLAPTIDSRPRSTRPVTFKTQSSLLEAVGVRLPTLSLGVFSGQADRWIAFHSLFNSTVHKNAKFSEVEKFTYLLSCLSGEPLNLLKSFPITAANYHIAHQQFSKCYNNSRLLITLLINNIFDLPINSSVKQPRIFISSLQENVSALRALQHDISQESLFMNTYLLRKFDNEFRSKFEHCRARSQQMLTVNEMIQFVGKECAQLEAANFTLVSHKPTTNTSAEISNSLRITTNKSPLGHFTPRMAFTNCFKQQSQL